MLLWVQGRKGCDGLHFFQKQKVVNKVVLLEIEAIIANPFQPRRQFEEKALEELAQSIAKNGLLQPVTVRAREDGCYELIAGERRLRACKLLGQETIPAIIQQADDEQSAMFALIENLQRRDLNYFEEAEGICLLMRQTGLSQEQTAVQLGKAQPTIANKLRLLAFSEPMRELMVQSGLTERHARALLRLPDEATVREAIAYIVQERLNVGESEKYIQTLLEQESQPQHPELPQSSPTRLFVVKDLRIFLNTISKAVSTMKLAGIEIDTEKQEDDEFIHFNLRIPKKGAYRSRSHSA